MSAYKLLAVQVCGMWTGYRPCFSHCWLGFCHQDQHQTAQPNYALYSRPPTI